MGTHTAFFYGTLMAPEILSRVIHGRSKSIQTHKFLPALLQNYRRHRVIGADYPAIIVHEGSNVRGSMVTNLTDSDIFRLDIFEGDQYIRKKVKVQILKGLDLNQSCSDQKDLDDEEEQEEEIEAETYIWCEDEKMLESKEWDFEAFKKDKMKAWMGEGDQQHGTETIKVDEGFDDVDKAVAELEKNNNNNNGNTIGFNDPTGGRGVNGFITRQLEEVSG